MSNLTAAEVEAEKQYAEWLFKPLEPNVVMNFSFVAGFTSGAAWRAAQGSQWVKASLDQLPPAGKAVPTRFVNTGFLNAVYAGSIDITKMLEQPSAYQNVEWLKKGPAAAPGREQELVYRLRDLIADQSIRGKYFALVEKIEELINT